MKGRVRHKSYLVQELARIHIEQDLTIEQHLHAVRGILKRNR